MTLGFAQCPKTIAIVDLFCTEPAPDLDQEAKLFDVVLKCTINTEHHLEDQVERFKPDRVILVTRDVAAIWSSLMRKDWRDRAGLIDQKIRIYEEILSRRLHVFDRIISFERFVAEPWHIKRGRDEIVDFNARHSQWAKENYEKKWSFGAVRFGPDQ